MYGGIITYPTGKTTVVAGRALEGAGRFSEEIESVSDGGQRSLF